MVAIGKKKWLKVWKFVGKCLPLQAAIVPNDLNYTNMRQLEMKQEDLTMQVDRKAFALELKTWRLRTGRTQREVAKDWGVSRWTILRAEGGKEIAWETAYKLYYLLSQALKEERGA